ncbi:hypothetical protein TNCV_826461 [Trichonephila clavipes]|nr:hypothetical protein TNCV_826461 [Trichonephila clavipes]
MVDITKDLETVDSEPEEDVTPLDEKLLREGLQLSVPEEALPCRSDDVILSSSDESDLAPIHKRKIGYIFIPRDIINTPETPGPTEDPALIGVNGFLNMLKPFATEENSQTNTN